MADNNDFNTLKKKVLELVHRFNELNEKNNELTKKVADYERERKKTRAKVDKIITKIEELEVD